MKDVTNIEKKTFEELGVEVGIISGNVMVNSGNDLENYYNTRDKEIYSSILKRDHHLILRYSNGENIITLDDEFLDQVEKSTKPIMLPKDGKRYGAYDAVIVPNYLEKRKNLAIGSFARDCAVIIVVEKNSGTIAFIHSGWKPLLSGIVTRSMEKMIECIGEDKEFDFHAMIMPHIKILELGPEIYPRIEKYKDKYLEEMIIESLIDNNISSNGKVYLYTTKAILAELVRFVPGLNIDVIGGDTRDKNENGELIYGSFRESKRARQILLKNQYKTIMQEEILISNIVKTNLIYLMQLNS